MKILILIIFVVFSNVSVSQDTIYIKKNLTLLSGTFNAPSVFKRLEQVKYEFNGYLIIEVDPKELLQNDSIIFYCNVFWIDSLSQFELESEKFHYYPLIRLSIIARLYEIKQGKDAEEPSNFLRFYSVFNEVNREYLNTYLYDSSLKTNMLEGKKLWKYGEKYYLAFNS